MNGGNMATCPTFSWGRGSVCHIGRQLYWKKKKKNLRLLISFGFATLGTNDRRREETLNKQEV